MRVEGAATSAHKFNNPRDIAAGPDVRVKGIFLHATVTPAAVNRDYQATWNDVRLVFATGAAGVQIASDLSQFASSVNAARRYYYATMQNSNSFAFSAIQSLGVPRPNPARWNWWVPAHGKELGP
jgi:hypothetical protein